jgi:hypothetical protein
MLHMARWEVTHISNTRVKRVSRVCMGHQDPAVILCVTAPLLTCESIFTQEVLQDQLRLFEHDLQITETTTYKCK